MRRFVGRCPTGSIVVALGTTGRSNPNRSFRRTRGGMTDDPDYKAKLAAIDRVIDEARADGLPDELIALAFSISMEHYGPLIDRVSGTMAERGADVQSKVLRWALAMLNVTVGDWLAGKHFERSEAAVAGIMVADQKP